jgi:precorrin-6B methylase 2
MIQEQFMRRALVPIGLVLLLVARLAAQQTGLTEGQIKTADLEVPELVKLFGLRPGMAVADVGAGFGAWTMRFSRAVGPSGRVYSTDMGAPQPAALREAAKREGLGNIIVIEGGINTTNLPALCCDAILTRDAYHHLTQPAQIIGSLAAALKPGERLAVIRLPAASEQRSTLRCAGGPPRARRAARSRRARGRRGSQAGANDFELEREQPAGSALSGSVPAVVVLHLCYGRGPATEVSDGDLTT